MVEIQKNKLTSKWERILEKYFSTQTIKKKDCGTISKEFPNFTENLFLKMFSEFLIKSTCNKLYYLRIYTPLKLLEIQF